MTRSRAPQYEPPQGAPKLVSDDPALPYNRCEYPERMRNLIHNSRVVTIIPWMQEATFDEVVTVWFYAQSTKKEKP